MFIRYKIVNGKKYYQIVETTRERKQRLVKHLGTIDKILKDYERLKLLDEHFHK